MKARNMLAVLILILGAALSFYCYTRLMQLLPMGDASAVSRADAQVASVSR